MEQAPLESAARSWWSDSSQRSVGFSTIGTCEWNYTSYTRSTSNGSNTAKAQQMELIMEHNVQVKYLKKLWCCLQLQQVGNESMPVVMRVLQVQVLMS